MKIELEDKLFKNHKKLFPNGRDVDIRENLMCFGFECGDGWYSLLDKLFTDIEKVSDDNTCIEQVKSKFGGLRVYTNIYTEEVDKLISDAEKNSLTICELCGKPGKPETENGWVTTICKDCLNTK